jgi:HAD superfamily hydrolase (TIGR01549 family)
MVALDLDGTLVDQAAAAGRWVGEFAESHGFDLAVEAVAEALSEGRPKGEVFAELVLRLELPVTADDMWADYRRRMPALVTCTPEDRQALIELRHHGWRLGIITNGMVDNQQGKIRALGLDALVDGWVISAEVGARKPERALFEALAARLGCPLEGWIIGDSLDHDIGGGAAVGLQTAWIARGEPPPLTDRRPDLVVDSVAEAAEEILRRS